MFHKNVTFHVLDVYYTEFVFDFVYVSIAFFSYEAVRSSSHAKAYHTQNVRIYALPSPA